MGEDELAGALLRRLRGTHLTLDLLKYHLDAVLEGSGEGITSYPDEDMVVSITTTTTSWGVVGGGKTTRVSTGALWRAVAGLLGYSEQRMAEAAALWDDAEIERQSARLPEHMLDGHWYVVGLRAHCLSHCSDRVPPLVRHLGCSPP
jgi:hypothetical protein